MIYTNGVSVYLSLVLPILRRLRQIMSVFSYHWIDLTQDKDRWRALVNAVMNLQIP